MSLKEKYELDQPKFDNFRIYEDSEGAHLFYKKGDEEEIVARFSSWAKPERVKKAAEDYLKKQQ